MQRLIRSFLRDRRGIVFAEFAGFLPIMVMILLGGFEAGRFVMIGLKLDRVATSLADVVAQQQGLTEAQMTDVLASSLDMFDPYNLCTGNVVISNVWLNAAKQNAQEVLWQRRIPTGAMGVTSKIGAEGKAAVLPGNLVPTAANPVVVAEVFFDYRPFFGGQLFPGKVLYSRAFSRFRTGAINNITPGAPGPSPCPKTAP